MLKAVREKRLILNRFSKNKVYGMLWSSYDFRFLFFAHRRPSKMLMEKEWWHFDGLAARGVCAAVLWLIPALGIQFEKRFQKSLATFAVLVEIALTVRQYQNSKRFCERIQNRLLVYELS